MTEIARSWFSHFFSSVLQVREEEKIAVGRWLLSTYRVACFLGHCQKTILLILVDNQKATFRAPSIPTECEVKFMTYKRTHFPRFPLNNLISLFADNLFEILESLTFILQIFKYPQILEKLNSALWRERALLGLSLYKKVPPLVIIHAGKSLLFILLLSKMPDGLT